MRYQLRGLDVHGIPFTDIVSNFLTIEENEVVVLESNVTVPYGASSIADLYIINTRKGPSVLDVFVSINCTDLDVEYTDPRTLTLIPQEIQAFRFKLFESGTSDAIGTITNCTAVIVEMCANTSTVQDFKVIVIGIVIINVTDVSESMISFEWITPENLDSTDEIHYTLIIDFNNGTTSVLVLDSDVYSFTITGLHPYQFVDVTLLSLPELFGNATIITEESGMYNV